MWRVAAHRIVGKVIAERRGANQPEVLIESDQAKVEGFVVKGVEGDAVGLIQPVSLGLAPGDDVGGHQKRFGMMTMHHLHLGK